jgi:hypothetical protein
MLLGAKKGFPITTGRGRAMKQQLQYSAAWRNSRYLTIQFLVV